MQNMHNSAYKQNNNYAYEHVYGCLQVQKTTTEHFSCMMMIFPWGSLAQV